MKKSIGTADVKLMECISPAKNKWRIRWDVQQADDGSATYMEEDFDHKPTEDEIKDTVIVWYNEQIDTNILSGFIYEDSVVWLSTENQFNYKAAYDLAVQTEGKSLPVMFKLGSEEEPVYKTFETLDVLADFYTRAMSHVQSTLQNGWKSKDNFKLENYRMD